VGTYNRRTKSGKIALVRKGDRSKPLLTSRQITNGLIWGGLIGSTAATLVLTHKANKVLNKALEKEDLIIAAQQAMPPKPIVEGAIDVKAVEFNYPSETYQRKSKLGRLTLVRKSQRQKKNEERNRIKGIAILGGIAALGLLGVTSHLKQETINDGLRDLAARDNARYLDAKTQEVLDRTRESLKYVDRQIY
jgi:hypothetical protein